MTRLGPTLFCLVTLWTSCSGFWFTGDEDQSSARGDRRMGVGTRSSPPNFLEHPATEEPDPLFTIDLGWGGEEEEEEAQEEEEEMEHEEEVAESFLELEQKLEEEEKLVEEKAEELFDWEHWIQRQNSRYDHGLGVHVKLSPTFNVNWDLSFGFPGANWWEGPNICQREEESEEIREPRSRGILHHHMTSTSRCDDTWSAYKCTTEISTFNITKRYSVIYQCCHGYQRERGRQGCPKELPMRTLLETLDDLKASDMKEALEGISISVLLETHNYTIFTPSDGLLDHFKPIENVSSNVVVVSPDVVEMARALEETVLSHVVRGVVRTDHMEDELLLPTISTGHSIRINKYEGRNKLITANCRPITSSDNMADNGVVHVVDGILPPVRDTIADLVTSNPDLSMFKTLVGQSGLLSMLRKSGQYTLLAPSNTAFSRLNPYVRQKLLDGDMCTAEVIRNHVLPNVICSGVLDADLMTINALNEHLRVDRQHEKLFVEGAQLLETDLMATNGVVHIIDEVLIPSGALTLPDVLRQMNASLVLDLVQQAGLMEEFTLLSQYTALIPSDSAIMSLDPASVAALRDDPARLREVLLYHVLNSTERLDDLEHGVFYSTHVGSDHQQVHVNVQQSLTSRMGMGNDKEATFQCARVEQHDVNTCGGVIHLIDRMLEPPRKTLLELIQTEPSFSVFAELLNDTGLADQLAGYGELTAFVPTNQAIDALTIDEKDFILDPANLETFLKQHFVKGRWCCASMLRSRMTFDTTVGGGLVMVSRRGRQLYVNQSPISACDRVARDGVAHAVERVHLPPYLPFHQVMHRMVSAAHDVTDRLDRYIDKVHDHVFGPRMAATRRAHGGMFGVVGTLGDMDPDLSQQAGATGGFDRKLGSKKVRGHGQHHHGPSRDRVYHRRGHREPVVRWIKNGHSLDRTSGQGHVNQMVNTNRRQRRQHRGRGHV